MSDCDVVHKKKCAAFIIMDHIIKKEEEKRRRRLYWIKHLYQNRSQNRLLTILSVDESTGHFRNFLRISLQQTSRY